MAGNDDVSERYPLIRTLLREKGLELATPLPGNSSELAARTAVQADGDVVILINSVYEPAAVSEHFAALDAQIIALQAELRSVRRRFRLVIGTLRTGRVLWVAGLPLAALAAAVPETGGGSGLTDAVVPLATELLWPTITAGSIGLAIELAKRRLVAWILGQLGLRP